MYAQREHLDTHLHTMYISEVHTQMFASGTHVCATCADQYTSVSDTNTSAPVKNTSVCTSSEFAPRRMSRAALDECSQNEHLARCAQDASQVHDARSKSTPRIPHESLRVCHRNGTPMNAHEMHAETAFKTAVNATYQHCPDGLLDERPVSRPLASMKRGLVSISDHQNNALRRPFFDTVFHRVVHRTAHGCPQGSRAPAHPLHDRTPVRVCDPNSRSIMKPMNSPTSCSPLRRTHTSPTWAADPTHSLRCSGGLYADLWG